LIVCRSEHESPGKARDPTVVGHGDDESYRPAADTKNLKAQFEQRMQQGGPDQATSEMSRKRMEEEFAIYKGACMS
jgi:hypothetical protein